MSRVHRWVLVVLVGLVAGLTAAGPAAADDAEPDARHPVVVIGVAGLLWQDVGPGAPAVRGLAGRGATGVLSVKAGDAVTCPADGWLTLGAGARAAASGVGREPCTAQVPQPTAEDADRNLDATDEAELGLLARSLGALDARGPGAVAASGPSAPGASSGSPLVRVVDAGVVGGPDRAGALRAADASVAQALAEAPAGADVLLVGLSEGDGDDSARLHVAIAAGPSFPVGTLRSASTRRDAYVQLIDVAPTVLALVGIEVPDAMDGEPWRAVPGERTPAALVDLDVRAVQGKAATVPFFVVLVAFQVLVPLALHRRPRWARAAAVGGLTALGASYASMLVPWWRSPAPLLSLLGVTALVAAPTAALCLRSRHPVGWACGGVAALLVADLVTGAHLQMESPAGYSSLVAGRFAGIGNVAFGVYGACVLLAAAALAGGRERRPCLALLGATGLVAVAVDGAPPWGSDVGGVLALLPAFLVLGMLLTGTRVSLLRLLLAGLAGAVVVTAFALADHARPEQDRTHLGRFVEQVRDGTAGEVLERKASAIGNLLFGNPVTALLPLVVALVVWLFLRPPAPLAAAFEAEPAFRAGLMAVGLVAALGFALNDSGPAVVALAVVVVIPATAGVIGGVAAGRAGAPAP